jgi:dihydrofolate reductase
MRRKIILVAAMDQNHGIGYQGKLPWTAAEVPGEMKWFTELTKGKTVVMGRKTAENVSLPGRHCYVLMNNENISISSEECNLEYLTFDKFKRRKLPIVAGLCNNDIYLIGGAETYKLFLEEDLVDEMYLSFVHGRFACDTYFPSHLIRSDRFWIASNEKPSEHFTTYKYVRREKEATSDSDFNLEILWKIADVIGDEAYTTQQGIKLSKPIITKLPELVKQLKENSL